MNFVLELLTTGILTGLISLILIGGVALFIPFYCLGQWLFKMPFVSKYLGTLWQRGAVIGTGMFCYGIYYGLNYILHHS